MTGSQTEKVKNKTISEVFRSCCLKISIETNLHITDFLDVTFNFKNGKYYSFRKPKNDLLQINTLSNHPRIIMEEILNTNMKMMAKVSQKYPAKNMNLRKQKGTITKL